MSILTDEELLALRNYAGEILPREVEKAVLVKLAAGVSVEPYATLHHDDGYFTTKQREHDLRYGGPMRTEVVTLDQLTTAIAAARLQGEQDAIKRLAAGVSVEPVGVVIGFDDDTGNAVVDHSCEGPYGPLDDYEGIYNLDQLNTAIAAARVQENERCAKRLEMFASLMDEAAKLIEQIPPEVIEALDGYRWPLCDELGGAAAIAKDEIRALLGKEQS